ncbi:NADP-dependent oxidoreductase domain-containing protein [Mycena vitilis]|nr:NADP-dependent oxidoreductase domain-containing protein [Mycena vitilis]
MLSHLRMAESEKWLLTGLKAGYRHIDTAYIYGTEPYLGAALRASGISREEVFVTTKLAWHHPKYLTRSFDDSLRRLGFDYVDLTVEFPAGYDAPSGLDQLAKQLKVVESPTFNETWAEFERLHASGRAKAIGVSNFSIKTLEQLLKTAKIVSAVNQVEMHPYLTQPELLEYYRAKGIVVVAYTPSEHEKLAGHCARGVAVVSKSSDVERQKQNLILPTLSAGDLTRINALDRGDRIWGAQAPEGSGFTKEQLVW